MDNSVCFAIASGKGISEITSKSLDMTIEVLHKLNIPYNKLYCGGHFLESIRAKLVREFLKGDFDNLFFIDADQEFSPIAVITLLNREEEIIAGVPPFKQYPESYPVDLITRDGQHTGKVIGPNLAILKASHVGTGFLRIKRSALERMASQYSNLLVREFLEEEPWLDLFGRITENGLKYGEDKSFCKRWTAIGGDLWVYPDIFFAHIGDHRFTGNLHEYLLKLKGGTK
jgi:hypothetical protein